MQFGIGWGQAIVISIVVAFIVIHKRNKKLKNNIVYQAKKLQVEKEYEKSGYGVKSLIVTLVIAYISTPIIGWILGKDIAYAVGAAVWIIAEALVVVYIWDIFIKPPLRRDAIDIARGFHRDINK
jgi:Na+/melibiose symporter-like transporter